MAEKVDVLICGSGEITSFYSIPSLEFFQKTVFLSKCTSQTPQPEPRVSQPLSWNAKLELQALLEYVPPRGSHDAVSAARSSTRDQGHSMLAKRTESNAELLKSSTASELPKNYYVKPTMYLRSHFGETLMELVFLVRGGRRTRCLDYHINLT